MKNYSLLIPLFFIGIHVYAQTTPETLYPEPTYNSSSQVLLFQDEFNYSTFAEAYANGWRGTNGASTTDITNTSDTLGSNQIISGGYDGTGHAMRLKYFGVETNTGTNQEARSWSRLQSDTLAATPGHTFYMSYNFRITPGTGFVLDQDPQHIVQVKWLELWKTETDFANRAEFDTGYSRCYNDVPKIGAGGSGTLWHFYGSGVTTTCQAGQVRAPFAYVGQGQWHRATHKYVTKSSSTARDGVAQMWVDGILILSVNSADCGTPVANAQSLYRGLPPSWCATEDLDAIFTQETVSKITLGSVMTGSLWPFTIDWDHMSMWRDNGSSTTTPPTPEPIPVVVIPPTPTSVPSRGGGGGGGGGSRVSTPIVQSSVQTSTSLPPEIIALILANRALFMKAVSYGISLPQYILDVLNTAPSSTNTTDASSYTRDLELGSQGPDVQSLQNYLIQKNVGPRAGSLRDSGASGYFGALTRSALVEYQMYKGISPASGYYGERTKGEMR